MSDETKKIDFSKLLDKQEFSIPQEGDVIKGTVVAASKSEVRLDVNGVMVGVVRGPELYLEDDEYGKLKPGDEAEAMVVENENENGELELSFKRVGQEKAWNMLEEAYQDKEPVTIKIVDANKGGLMARFRQIKGFLPVSQLAPEHYPRVSGGDKSKILDKLKKFVGEKMEVNVITLEEGDDKIIFSEKELWNKRKKDVISQYKEGMVVEGTITAITNFGVFVSFGENMEGLIHISELAWQRIDSPHDLVKVGDTIKAEVVKLEGSKIFLSAKKLMKDPWHEATKKYKEGTVVEGEILKVNPFGLFVKLDEEIHGLAHISELGLKPKEKINEIFSAGEKRKFEIINISPEEHRLGLKLEDKKDKKSKKDQEETSEKNVKKDTKKDIEEIKEDKSEDKDEKESKKKVEKKEDVKKDKKEADKETKAKKENIKDTDDK
ncbi:MAG TPA: S1 RNA-binding domain-containing protein [Patescibacteria group bacterium]|nr:S1 RNA-binding domain-containing protein [Patescibacteria group bacterium]